MNPASQPGDQETLPPADRERAFHLKPVWQRFLIVLAGPLANFLLAIAIIAAFIGVYGVPSTPNVVGQVVPNSAADRAGLRPGDRIVEIAGRATPNFEAIGDMTLLRPDERLPVLIERSGTTFTRWVTLGATEQVDRFGQRFRIGRLGVGSTEPRMEPVGALNLIPTAVKQTFGLTRAMIDGLWQIISGRRSVKDLGGPIKMAQIAGQQASLGAFEFIQLLALFSINLGFINLLPIPMLDGGHLMFYAAEAVRRRPVSAQAQEWAFRGGLAFLMALLLFVTANDLLSIGLFDRLGRLIG